MQQIAHRWLEGFAQCTASRRRYCCSFPAVMLGTDCAVTDKRFNVSVVQTPTAETKAINLNEWSKLKVSKLAAMKSLEVLLLDQARGSSSNELGKILSALPGAKLKWLSLPSDCTRLLSKQAWWVQLLPPTRDSIAMLACRQLAVLDLSR